MGRLLPEWLNANYHKAYPFAESTAGISGGFPSTFLLDMQLLTGGPINVDRTYIGRVEQDGSSVSLYLFTVPTDTDTPTELGLLARIPFNTAPETEIPVELKNDDVGALLNGYVTVGLADISQTFPDAVTEIEEAASLLYDGVVIPVTNWTTALIVNGELVSGDINLVAGSGINFRAGTLTQNGVQVPVIYVECVDSIQGNSDITTDQELADYIYNKYGRPVCSINGCKPNLSNGDIQIQIKTVDATTSDDTTNPSVTISSGGTGYLTITDNRTAPCCTLDDQQIVINNIAAVNERAARLENTITALETNLNGISAQQALLGSNK